MIKALIYNIAKSATQSGTMLHKKNKWVLEFKEENLKNTFFTPLMGGNPSDFTRKQVKLEFSSKEKAIEYAKNKNIKYELLDNNYPKISIKSYTENFTKHV